MMTDPQTPIDNQIEAEHRGANPQKNTPEKTKQRNKISMHEDIPVWYDCCSCEAEPYWLDAMAIDNQADEES